MDSAGEASVRVWGDLSARERDALVAEHVMGWRFFDVQWSPTTDIAAAFRVVDRMRGIGWLRSAWWRRHAGGRCVQITSRADGWHVAIYPLDGSPDPASASGPLPEAICHAAVRACGVDV